MQPNSSNVFAPSQPARWSFDRSALPGPRSFYERELGELRRPSRGWASPKAGCPFHQSESKKSFWVHLESGAFKCFGCDAKGGDVLAFVRQRYRLGFREAVEYCGAVREVTPEGRKQIDKLKRERERAEAEKAAQKEQEHQERIAARDHLHAVEVLYDEAIAEHDWLGMSELLPRVRQAEQRYWQLAGFEVQHER